MTAKEIQLIPSDELQIISQDIKTIKELLAKRPEQLFQDTWIESKKIPALLGISSRTWQSWRDKKIIPFSQFGAKIFVRLEDLNKLLESHMVKLQTA